MESEKSKAQHVRNSILSKTIATKEWLQSCFWAHRAPPTSIALLLNTTGELSRQNLWLMIRLSPKQPFTTLQRLWRLPVGGYLSCTKM
jgi:2-iminoacetate synthase ThiH